MTYSKYKNEITFVNENEKAKEILEVLRKAGTVRATVYESMLTKHYGKKIIREMQKHNLLDILEIVEGTNNITISGKGLYIIQETLLPP